MPPLCFQAWASTLIVPGGAPSGVVVLDEGRRLGFGFEEIVRYNGGRSPGGVALAFQALALGLPLLADGSLVERREVAVRSAFGGPGVRDAFEHVLRAVTAGHYAVDPDLARRENGHVRERFVFAMQHEEQIVTTVLREGFVTAEFVELAGLGIAGRSPDQEARLTVLKDELTARVMAVAPADVFDVELRRQSS